MFSDDNSFCLEDGTALILASDSYPSVYPPVNEIPTLVIPRPQVTSEMSPQTVSGGASKWLFLIIGILATTVVGMGVFMFTGRSEKAEQKENVNQNVKNENSKENKNQAENTSSKNTPKVNQTIEKTSQKLQITKEDAQNLINRWEQAQDARKFGEYRALYSPQFLGIKRTKSGSQTQMNYSQWMNDRQKMMKNIVDVEVANLNITIDGDTASAQFTQNFQSANYQDTGQKIMRIKIFADGAKIIYEELKYAN